MHFKVGIFIGTTLLLLIPQRSSGIRACTSFADLADPCGCTLTKDNFDPLCGSDGNTYLNACFLHCRETIDKVTLRVEHKGICSEEGRCTCNANYDPVCASNGITYSNDCVLKCHAKKNPSLRLKYSGECDDNQRTRLRSRITKTCICNPLSGPICATNGVSYANYCVMRCKAEAMNDKSVKFAYWGLCSSQEIGPSNADQLVVEGGHKKKEPSIIQIKPRPEVDDDRLNMVVSRSCLCAAVHKPVCGTDHHTYANMCVLHCRAKKNPAIKFLQWGNCQDVRLVSRLPDLEDDGIMMRTGHIRSGAYRGRYFF